MQIQWYGEQCKNAALRWTPTHQTRNFTGEKWNVSVFSEISSVIFIFLVQFLVCLERLISCCAQGEPFVVPAGSFSYSVVLYTVCALASLGLLAARRALRLFGQAELGGPRGPALASAGVLCLLWLLYIVLSSLEATGHVSGFWHTWAPDEIACCNGFIYVVLLCYWVDGLQKLVV